jgi:spermidine/putrescine transport system substrate-binding protein
MPSKDTLSRRQMLSRLGQAGGTLFGAGLFSSCTTARRQSESEKRINIYSWADYLHPDVIPEFQKRFGIQVFYDTFASNEALLAKLQAGAANYDIVVPSGYMVGQLERMGLLSVIEPDRLANLKNLMPRFLEPLKTTGNMAPPVAAPDWPDQVLAPRLSVPYTWGTTGIAYNWDALAKIFGKPPERVEEFRLGRFDLFWDERFRGRMTLLDDERETLGMSLKRLGFSYNTTARTALIAAKEQLVRQKPLLMCYSSDQIIVQLASGDSWLSLAFSGDAAQATRANPSARYLVPEMGTSIWTDSFCIPKTAPHTNNAYKWINFLLEPEIAAKNAIFTRYATPNKEAFLLLPQDLTGDRNLYPTTAVIDRCEQIGDLGKALFTWDEMWTELKCA